VRHPDELAGILAPQKYDWQVPPSHPTKKVADEGEFVLVRLKPSFAVWKLPLKLSHPYFRLGFPFLPAFAGNWGEGGVFLPSPAGALTFARVSPFCPALPAE
jgi:hypothetical protein